LQDISDRELWLGLFKGPAVAANRMSVFHTANNGGVRLSFGEQYDNAAPVEWRAGVVLSEWHAYQLWELLNNSVVVQHWKREVEEMQAASATVPPGAGIGDE